MRRMLVSVLILSSTILYGCNNPEKEKQVVTPPAVEEAVSQPEIPLAKPEDDELVKVQDYISDIAVEIKYAETDNFTGVVIYDDDTAYLRYGTVKKLAEVQKKLKEKGFCLKIWDAYRPVSAQFKLWEVCPDPSFVANPNTGYSAHSRGNTVDITITDLTGKDVTMPSGFDEFGKTADRNYGDVSKEAAENSLLLEQVMEECGFKGYSKEWWHYSDSDEYSVIEE